MKKGAQSLALWGLCSSMWLVVLWHSLVVACGNSMFACGSSRMWHVSLLWQCKFIMSCCGKLHVWLVCFKIKRLSATTLNPNFLVSDAFGCLSFFCFQQPLVTMAASTSAQDSVANFRRQAALVCLDNKWIDGLIAHGMDTLGRLAFAVTSPGVPADDAGVTNLLNAALPAEAVNIADLMTLKRMIFEAQTALIGSIRAQADPASDPLLRKLPPAERALRITNQKARLTGLRLEGSMEVGHAVYDAVAGMLEADSLRYMAPSKAITRMQEITSTKPPKELKLDSSGSGIVVRDVAMEKDCVTNTELDVQEAMTRRALAFDLVGLIDYNVFQEWTSRLFQLMRQPAPPGFKQPSLVQLLRTDRQCFVRMQELARDGIKPRPDGTRPLDAILQNMHNDSSVMFYMLPAQQVHRERSRSPYKDKKSSWNKQDKWNANESWQGWEKKQGKGNKGQQWNSGKLPLALKGCASATPDGKRICFSFNISTCDKAQPGGSCDKGAHVCATKGCHEYHPHHSCPKKG